jgi:hypothetical protein
LARYAHNALLELTYWRSQELYEVLPPHEKEKFKADQQKLKEDRNLL